MAKSQRNLIFGLLLLVSSFLPALGQEPRPRAVNIRFSTYALNPPTEIGYFPKEKSSIVGIKFYGASRSQAFQYTGSPDVKFYDVNNPKSDPIAVWKSEGKYSNAFLLFLPRHEKSTDGTTYSIYAVDDSLTRIPQGHFAILNLAGRDYDGRSGKHNFAVAQGVNDAVAGSGVVYVELSIKQDSKKLVVGGIKFDMKSSERSLILVFPPVKKTGLQPVLRSLVDYETAKQEDVAK